MGTTSQQLAEFVAALRYEDLPPDVVAAAKRHILDAVGVALAASAVGAGSPVIEMTRSWAGARESSVLGYDFGAPAPWAALANGTLTRRGFTGPSTIFEGPHGLFDAFLAGEEPDRARLIRGLGSEWETTRIAIKPYPACHFVHAFMDAGVEAGIKWADIEEIVCYIT